MRGLVTRDLIKHCTGCPNLDFAQETTPPVKIPESALEEGSGTDTHQHTCGNTGNNNSNTQ